MKVTEAVIRDLHVLVQADEASPDSQALVAAWLAEHPSFAEEPVSYTHLDVYKRQV